MEAPLIVGIIFFSVVAIVKIAADAATRRRLIERGEADDKIRALAMGYSELSTLNNLKWGMVLVGVGLASLISYWMPEYLSEEGAIGLIFIFAGLGFLIYYPLAQRRLKETQQRHSGGSDL